MRILKIILVSTSKEYKKSCNNKIKRRAYFVKHFISDLAGRLSTPIFFIQILMGEARSASPLTLGKKSRCA